MRKKRQPRLVNGKIQIVAEWNVFSSTPANVPRFGLDYKIKSVERRFSSEPMKLTELTNKYSNTFLGGRRLILILILISI